MSLKGHVSSMGLDEVFSLIAGNGLAGTLVVSTARTAVQIYFLDGELVVPAWITGLDEDASPDLIQARRRKCQQAMQKVLACQDASYVFRPNKLPSGLDSPTSLRFDPQALIMESAREKDETRRLGKHSVESCDSDVWGLAGRPRPVVQGGLDGIGLPALLQSLRTQRRTGTLKVGTRERHEKLYFEEGKVFALRAEDAEDEFTRAFLGKSGRASVRTLSGRFDLNANHDPDATSDDDDDEQRVRDGFLEVLFWEGAGFRFVPDQLPPDFEERKLSLRTDRFLLEAIQRIETWERIQPMLDGGRAVFRFLSAEGKLRAIRERDCPDLLTLVDGLRSFDELVRVVGTARLEAGRLIADLFREGQLIRCVRAPQRRLQPAVTRRLMAAAG